MGNKVENVDYFTKQLQIHSISFKSFNIYSENSTKFNFKDITTY